MFKDGDYIVQKWQNHLLLSQWDKHAVAFADLMFLLLADGHPAQLREYGLPTYFQIEVSKN